MKKFLRGLVLWLLKRWAKRRLKGFKGKVIGVTGSIGKTSTKEAIYSVLNTQFKVKKTQKSMNSDFGLPLTILDIDSGFSSAFTWSWLLAKAFYNSLFADHSDVLLLELGADKPGDMDFLISIVRPDIAIMTNVFPVHLGDGQFKDLQEIFEEKSKLIESLGKSGVAILNIDNPFVDNLVEKCKETQVVTFGFGEKADYRASEVKLSTEGVSFILNKAGKKFEARSSVLGEYQVYTLVPALICAEVLGMSMEDAIRGLDRYCLPPGRMGIIPAKKDSVILDSTYNSSPESLKQALRVLEEIGIGKRKVAVLGSMNELGEKSDDLHAMVGELIPQHTDLLLTVGVDAKIFAEKAKEKGMKEEAIFTFTTAHEAAEFFKKKIETNDVILVKGSQNLVRLERFVKEFMAEPERAKELLVRQEKVWQAKI